MKLTTGVIAILAATGVAVLGMMTFLIVMGKDVATLVAAIVTLVPLIAGQLLTYAKVDKINTNVNGHLSSLRKAAGLPDPAVGSSDSSQVDSKP
jgi:hypothetical protein